MEFADFDEFLRIVTVLLESHLSLKLANELCYKSQGNTA